MRRHLYQKKHVHDMQGAPHTQAHPCRSPRLVRLARTA